MQVLIYIHALVHVYTIKQLCEHINVTMDVLEVESFVRGHHVYMQEWTPFIAEKLECEREEASEQDPYAVAIVKRTAGRRTKIVGHVPRRISTPGLFLQRSGNIKCTITEARRYSSDLLEGRLEVPCTLLLVDSSLRNTFKMPFHLPRATT